MDELNRKQLVSGLMSRKSNARCACSFERLIHWRPGVKHVFVTILESNLPLSKMKRLTDLRAVRL